jgi:hypothetical protein
VAMDTTAEIFRSLTSLHPLTYDAHMKNVHAGEPLDWGAY